MSPRLCRRREPLPTPRPGSAGAPTYFGFPGVLLPAGAANRRPYLIARRGVMPDCRLSIVGSRHRPSWADSSRLRRCSFAAARSAVYNGLVTHLHASRVCLNSGRARSESMQHAQSRRAGALRSRQPPGLRWPIWAMLRAIARTRFQVRYQYWRFRVYFGVIHITVCCGSSGDDEIAFCTRAPLRAPLRPKCGYPIINEHDTIYTLVSLAAAQDD